MTERRDIDLPEGSDDSSSRRAGRESAAFRRGDVLADRFEIDRFIAQGGAGEVYAAEDLELRCPVALKVVRPELAARGSAMERFRREIQLARRVTHPNVCRIHDVFSHEGDGRRVLFFTMELLSGEDLASRLRRLGPLKAEEALPLARQICAGLEAVHEAGIIHRDLKTANVVLVPRDKGYRAVLTDFGLARTDALHETATTPSITRVDVVVGTPSYLAPEQLTGGEVSFTADVYALGIVLYEMVTGQRPFTGESELSTAVRRLTDEPPSPRLHAPDLTPTWERAILKCLERDPEKRFQRLDQLAAALEGKVGDPVFAAGPLRILIVDDDPDLLLGLSVLLRADGYDVNVASEGVQAITEARAQRPDLVLLDIGLPAGDGFWVLEKLRNTTPLHNVPVVVLTALDAETNEPRALSAGADAFFQKPADPKAVLEAVGALIQRAKDDTSASGGNERPE